MADKVHIRQVGIEQIEEYDKIPMLVHVKSILKLVKVNGGLGGIAFEEVAVKEYVKDLGAYDNSSNVVESFDTTNWAFFIAYYENEPVGGAIVAAKSKGVDMLDNRDDLTVLWDLRVSHRYQQKGMGTLLWNKAVDWARDNGYRQMKIECQNNNVRACNFYARRGAILAKIDEYAYYDVVELRDEVQLIWYLDL